MKKLCLAVLLAYGTAANALTFAFPIASSTEHTSTFDGTVAQANAKPVGIYTAGDYIQDSAALPTLTFSSYSFDAPLINYTLLANENFNILVNGSVIGSFVITPVIAATGEITGSGSFSPITVSGLTTLQILLTNTVPLGLGSVGAGTPGSFTFNAAPAAVPEPASWAMFIGGFGLIGSGLRRRRTSVSFD